MRSWVTQIRKGLLDFCVLNAIHARETYGYELVQHLRAVEQLSVTESTVYPILNRLREDGYVKVRLSPSSSGPPRRYFCLTALGRHRLREMNAYWDGLGEAIAGLRASARKESQT